MNNPNPPITRLLFLATLVESLVLLVAGGGLLIFPNTVKPEWPWPLSPFNALLLGAVYTASLVATSITVYARRWAPARIVAPMILLFTVIVLVISLTDLQRFDFDRAPAYVWFVLYIGIPLNAAYFLYRSRGQRTFTDEAPRKSWDAAIFVPLMLLGAYGLGLLTYPELFDEFWPWPIDDFHGRMYSVIYLTPALGAALMWRGRSPIEMTTLGLTLIPLGLIPVIGLVLVDADVDRVDWGATGTWLWLMMFSAVAVVGLGLVWRGSAGRSRATTPDKLS